MQQLRAKDLATQTNAKLQQLESKDWFRKLVVANLRRCLHPGQPGDPRIRSPPVECPGSL